MLYFFLRLLSGRVGTYLRKLYFRLRYGFTALSCQEFCDFYGAKNMYFDDDVRIGAFSFFIASQPNSINISHSTRFNRNVHINASVCGAITIGPHCLIGPNVVMRTASHRYSDHTKTIASQGHICGDIIVGRNDWIGANVFIKGGVSIGNDCVVGAGSVVTKSFGDGLVIGGVPAKIILER